MKSLLLLCFIPLLTGCVGFFIPDLEDRYENFKVEEHGDLANKIIDQNTIRNKDGKELIWIEKKYEWCGITLQAMHVPLLPIKLPLCTNGKALQFTDGKPTAIYHKYVYTSLISCGPGTWPVSWIGHPHEDNVYLLMGFCAKFDDH